MPYEPTESLEVRCWDRPVGVLALDPTTGFYAFQYYPDFAKSGLELAPLTMPLSAERVFVFPRLPDETFFRLPACFADCLPDAFGNALIDSWMASQGIRREQITPLDRLAYLGKRAMGALEFAPPLREGDQLPSALEMNELVKEARRAVVADSHQDSPHVVRLTGWQADGLRPDVDIRPELAQLIAVGSSAGGARAKAVVGYNPDTDKFVSGQFDLPEGYSPWLLKFDTGPGGAGGDGFDGTEGRGPEYGRIEFAYAAMARDCGIEMTECRLYQAAGRAHFMTRRFDRAAGPDASSEGGRGTEPTNAKLHLQTLCGLAELDFRQVEAHDYSELFMVVEQLGLGYDAIDQAFVRMVFNVCMANCDDHSKNHSFLMDAQGSWRLAPAYDLTHSYRADSYWVSKHLMSVNGRFTDIRLEDLMRVAARFNVADPGGVIKQVKDVAAHWPDYARAAGVDKMTLRQVQADIRHFTDTLQ
ncbi:MAG: type II toxin-antitoxin system HipA family toxin [Coriobacteriales bacterium]|jgi:serine/threonine-protein kinase HipA|nr:type II toxin-antitoxin system HipA family toxin [Coriobacteriales bacterium]